MEYKMAKRSAEQIFVSVQTLFTVLRCEIKCHNRKCVTTHLILLICPVSPSVYMVTLKSFFFFLVKGNKRRFYSVKYF